MAEPRDATTANGPCWSSECHVAWLCRPERGSARHCHPHGLGPRQRARFGEAEYRPAQFLAAYGLTGWSNIRFTAFCSTSVAGPGARMNQMEVFFAIDPGPSIGCRSIE